MALTNDSGNAQFLRVEGGTLLAFRGKGNPYQPFTGVNGILDSVSLYEDAAEGFELRSKARIVLADGEEKYIIECGASTLFSRMFAAYLPGIQKGDSIKIHVRQASQDAGPNYRKMTSCFVEASDGTKYAYNKVTGETEGARLAEVEKRFMEHPAYVIFSRHKAESFEDQAKKICEENDWYAKKHQAEFKTFIETCSGVPWASVMVKGIEGGCKTLSDLIQFADSKEPTDAPVEEFDPFKYQK